MLTALVIVPLAVAGALYATQAQPKTLSAAPVDLSVPNLTGSQLGQWCIDRKAQGTHGLSDRSRRWLTDCIALFGADLVGAPNPTPTGSGSSAPGATPTPTTPTSPSSSSAPTTTQAPSIPPSVVLPPGTTGCVTAPSRCGFPDATNTGPSGSLAVSTRTTYQTAGEVIRDVEIRGCVEVRAANVTFRNVRFVGNGCHYLVRNSSSGLRIEDAEANCNNGPNSAMAGPGGFTVLRSDVHHCENGFDVQSNNVTVQDTWIHDMYDGGDAHTDGMQFGEGASNITVNHNSIIMSLRSNAAVIMWDEGGAQNANVAFTNNLFSGANYTLRCARYGTSTNVYVTGNRFGPNVSGYDKTDSCTGGHVTSWSGNVLDSNGSPLAAS